MALTGSGLKTDEVITAKSSVSVAGVHRATFTLSLTLGVPAKQQLLGCGEREEGEEERGRKQFKQGALALLTDQKLLPLS